MIQVPRFGQSAQGTLHFAFYRRYLAISKAWQVFGKPVQQHASQHFAQPTMQEATEPPQVMVVVWPRSHSRGAARGAEAMGERSTACSAGLSCS